MELIAPEYLPTIGLVYSNSYRLRLEKKGRFPKRVRLSDQRYAYVRAEILEYCARLVAERDAADKRRAANAQSS